MEGGEEAKEGAEGRKGEMGTTRGGGGRRIWRRIGRIGGRRRGKSKKCMHLPLQPGGIGAFMPPLGCCVHCC